MSLAKKGESHFKVICADAQLICNKSDRDRAGWDFIVDFPFDNQEARSLDKRSAPASCHVQVKTVYAGTTNVRLKLNMAERLVKGLGPSFVLVIKVDDNLSVTDAYLIHLMGDRLGHVLKRLRKEQANGTPLDGLNKKFKSKLRKSTRKALEALAIKGQSLPSPGSNGRNSVC